MAATLTLEEKARYAEIIDGILDGADLESITRRAIVDALEAKIGKDTSGQKAAIKELIISRFNVAAVPADDKRSASEQATDDTVLSGDSQDDQPSGASAKRRSDRDFSDQNPRHQEPPSPAKKQKRVSSIDADAQLAARLQAQEDSRARSRSTRGSNSNAATGTRAAARDAKKKAVRKKSAAKIRSEDDSDVDGGAAGKKRAGGGGGFNKPYKLSSELSSICGGEEQVVKKLWEYIKGNDLQDPSDRRRIICDSRLEPVLGKETDAFSMNKLIGKHLYPVEE